jgi:hypothetical protein
MFGTYMPGKSLNERGLMHMVISKSKINVLSLLTLMSYVQQSSSYQFVVANLSNCIFCHDKIAVRRSALFICEAYQGSDPRLLEGLCTSCQF